MWSGRTQRRWHFGANVIGLVGPNDVHDLQTKVQAYHAAILIALDTWVRAGNKLDASGSTFSQATWDALTKREESFLAESVAEWNPLAYILAGSAYERGREILTELDSWRDFLASKKAAQVPDPIAVPHADLGLAGGIGFALAAVVAILVLRDLKH